MFSLVFLNGMTPSHERDFLIKTCYTSVDSNMEKNIQKTVFFWGVMVLVATPAFFFPWMYTPFQTGKMWSFMVLVEILLPIFLLLVFKSKNKIVFPKSTYLFLAYLLAFLIVSLLGVDVWNSLFGNTDRYGGLFYLMHIGLFLLYLHVAVINFGEKAKHAFVLLFVAIAVLASVYGVLESVSLVPTMAYLYFPRVSSVFGNPAFFSNFLLVPFFLSLYQSKISKSPYLYYAASFIIAIGIFLSGTRGALLGLIAGLFVFAVVHFAKSVEKNRQRKFFLSFVGTIGLFAILFFAAFSIAPEGSVFHRVTHLTGDTSSQRLNYWLISLEGWTQDPLLGLGYGNFFVIGDSQFESGFYDVGDAWPDKPHNQLIEVLVTGGLFVFLVYITFLFMLLKEFWKEKRGALFIGGLVSVLVSTFFLFDTSGSLVGLCVLIAIARPEEQFVERACEIKSWLKMLGGMVAVVLAVWLVTFVHLPYYRTANLVGDAQVTLEVDTESALLLGAELNNDTGLMFDLYTIADIQYSISAAAGEAGYHFSDLEELFESTEHTFDQLMQRHPLRAEYWNKYASYAASKGTIAIRSGEGDLSDIVTAAYGYSMKAHELAPNRAEPFITLAHLLHLSDDTEQSIYFAEKAFAIAPFDAEAQGMLGLIYLWSDREKEAIPLLHGALDHELEDPDHTIAHWLIERIQILLITTILFCYLSASLCFNLRSFSFMRFTSVL
jgi:O-antigen ligase